MGRLMLLLAVNALLAAAVVRLAATPADVAPIPPDRRQAPAIDAADPGEDVLPELADLDRNQVVTRPLFAPSRRAWQPPAVPEPDASEADPAEAPELPAEFALVGVAIANGKGQALIRDLASDADAVWVTEGETIGGYTLAEVSGQSAQLQRDGKSFPLELYPAPGEH